jgi:ribosome-binding protein aMBF1 (putative translation factor)
LATRLDAPVTNQRAGFHPAPQSKLTQEVAVMIKNERQYYITKAQADRFERTIAETKATPQRDLHPVLRKAEIDGLTSQLAELRRELEEYEALRSGKRRVITLHSIEELPKTLIQARIAAGLSQEEFAAKLGLKAQQVQRKAQVQ